MAADEGAELRDALEALQDARKVNNAHRAESALERVLLSTSANVIEMHKESVAAAVRLLRTPDDNGTIRLEVRDHAMTRRRWFEVNANGETIWGDR